MSSHHIVREKQEPALLIMGLDNFPDELLGQLLEWSPTVIATELMAEKLNAYGIKIDWVIANDTGADIQSDVKLLLLKNNSVIETAFEFLIANNYSAVNVVADELQLDDYLSFSDKINLVIFYNQQKIYAVNSGFSKWMPVNETIKFLTTPKELRVSGLDKIQENMYTTIADGIVTIQFGNTYMFIAENL